MDAESLAQVEKIITTAVSGVEGRLREDMQALGTSLRQEFGSEMQALRQEFGEKFDEAKGHRGVLYEDVLHRIDLVVEGHQALHQRIDRLEAGVAHEFIETRSLMQLSYRQLQERVETLEQRVQLIEKRLGLAN